VGYDIHTKAYKLFNPRTKKVVLWWCHILWNLYWTKNSQDMKGISSLEPNTSRDFGSLTWPHTTIGFPNVS
jgi:hypothetical protein